MKVLPQLTPEAAADRVEDGSVMMVGGFGMTGNPVTLLGDGLPLVPGKANGLAWTELGLKSAAPALADGRDFCIPEDIRDLASDVLSHRVAVRSQTGLSQQAEESRWVLNEIVDRTRIPM